MKKHTRNPSGLCVYCGQRRTTTGKTGARLYTNPDGGTTRSAGPCTRPTGYRIDLRTVMRLPTGMTLRGLFWKPVLEDSGVYVHRATLDEAMGFALDRVAVYAVECRIVDAQTGVVAFQVEPQAKDSRAPAPEVHP